MFYVLIYVILCFDLSYFMFDQILCIQSLPHKYDRQDIDMRLRNIDRNNPTSVLPSHNSLIFSL